MAEIVHIKFEKLTGLKGTIEGHFKCEPSQIDPRLPLIFQSDEVLRGYLVFSQHEELIYMSPMGYEEYNNYREHLGYGINFLIKEWSYGSGVGRHSESPN